MPVSRQECIQEAVVVHLKQWCKYTLAHGHKDIPHT